METKGKGGHISAPVLLLAYNRPELTRQVVEQVQRSGVKRLYIALDGPQDLDDSTLCAQVERVISGTFTGEKIWLKRESNLGCKRAVTGAIDWFFEQEEFGIILEDDTLPSISFFRFATELLGRFARDARVMKISGFNPVLPRSSQSDSYFFSHVSFSWGWASWRRAWAHNDLSMALLNEVRQRGLDSFPALDSARKTSLGVAEKGLDTWDYQWDFNIASQHGLHIVPKANLIQNIGFGISATHTRNPHTLEAAVGHGNIFFPLKHPPGIVMPDLSYQKQLRKWQSRARSYRNLTRAAAPLIRLLRKESFGAASS